MAKYNSPLTNASRTYGPTPSKAATKAAFHEVNENPPAAVRRTARKQGAEAARRQAVAIALSKARRSASNKD